MLYCIFPEILATLLQNFCMCAGIITLLLLSLQTCTQSTHAFSRSHFHQPIKPSTYVTWSHTWNHVVCHVVCHVLQLSFRIALIVMCRIAFCFKPSKCYTRLSDCLWTIVRLCVSPLTKFLPFLTTLLPFCVKNLNKYRKNSNIYARPRNESQVSTFTRISLPPSRIKSLLLPELHTWQPIRHRS